jgi:hypothetical protein
MMQQYIHDCKRFVRQHAPMVVLVMAIVFETIYLIVVTRHHTMAEDPTVSWQQNHSVIPFNWEKQVHLSETLPNTVHHDDVVPVTEPNDNTDMNHANTDMNHDNTDMNHDKTDINHDNTDMNHDSTDINNITSNTAIQPATTITNPIVWEAREQFIGTGGGGGVCDGWNLGFLDSHHGCQWNEARKIVHCRIENLRIDVSKIHSPYGVGKTLPK